MKNFKIFLIPEGSNRKLLRLILLALIFIFCALAFNWNFKNKIDKLNNMFIDDKFKIISEQEVLLLGDIRLSFKAQLGMGIEILVDDNKDKSFVIPTLKSDAVFIAVNVANHEAILIVPMLIEKIMGEDTRILLEEELSACLEENTAFQCISDVSDSILKIINSK